jgi:hypothetical protein
LPVSLTPPKNLSAVAIDTDEQFFGGVVDTGDEFLAFWLLLTSINDTGEQFYRWCQRHRRKIVRRCQRQRRKDSADNKTAISPAAGVGRSR